MKKSNMKNSPLMKFINNSLITLPTPTNISMWWNFGSLLGLYLIIQIISGLFLSMHYCPNTENAFESIVHITKDVNYGSKMRKIHMNGASLFFICMYTHMARGIFYKSYKLTGTWTMGVMIYILSMSTAFMGYILPWGQMSYWGATVITNLMTAIPIFGISIVQWLWGGYSVDNPTLNRFYTLHFILPIIIILLVFIHLMFLHQTGSSNPLGINSNLNKTPFHPYFTIKDIMGMMIMSLIFMLIMKAFPNILKDNDNFIQATVMVTPLHIQPEWYFLFAYAILRSIPSKLGGVIALMSSILILFYLPFTKSAYSSSTSFQPLSKFIFWMFVSSMIMLTWLGTKNMEFPYLIISQIYSTIYFAFFLSTNFINKIESKLMNLVNK